MFTLVELFRFVGEPIGFEVFVFGPAGPDIEPGRCTFLSILVFRIFQNLEIFPRFLRNSCDEIICWFWVTIVTVIFTCRYFKLSWNTSALSQSNGRNFSGSRINTIITEGKICWMLICQWRIYVFLGLLAKMGNLLFQASLTSIGFSYHARYSFFFFSFFPKRSPLKMDKMSEKVKWVVFCNYPTKVKTTVFEECHLNNYINWAMIIAVKNAN